MINTYSIAPGLYISWSPGCPDIWLHAVGDGTTGAIALDQINAPLVRKAFTGWAYRTIRYQNSVLAKDLPLDPCRE